MSSLNCGFSEDFHGFVSARMPLFGTRGVMGLEGTGIAWFWLSRAAGGRLAGTDVEGFIVTGVKVGAAGSVVEVGAVGVDGSSC